MPRAGSGMLERPTFETSSRPTSRLVVPEAVVSNRSCTRSSSAMLSNDDRTSTPQSTRDLVRLQATRSSTRLAPRERLEYLQGLHDGGKVEFVACRQLYLAALAEHLSACVA